MPESKAPSRPDLVVPIYLDTNLLLDLLASIEGGFTLVEKLSTERGGTTDETKKIGGEFGVANVLNLLKLGVSAGAERERKNEAAERRESERYHSYGSLLYRLRNTLIEQQRLVIVDDPEMWPSLLPSSLVELRGTFRLNPLLEACRRFERLAGLFPMFARLGTAGQQVRQQGQGRQQSAPGRQGGQRPTDVDQGLRQIEEFRKAFGDLVKDLTTGGIYDFVIEEAGQPDRRAVAGLYAEYLRDKTLSEIVGGDFWLLGKVIKNLSHSPDDAIDLLRASSFGVLSEDALQPLLESLGGPAAGMFSIPRLERKITAPAIQVVPIAVYV